MLERVDFRGSQTAIASSTEAGARRILAGAQYVQLFGQGNAWTVSYPLLPNPCQFDCNPWTLTWVYGRLQVRHESCPEHNSGETTPISVISLQSH